MPYSREGYLWTTSGASEGLETDSVIPSSKTINPEYDVVVIGSGFAGLVAARDLSRDRETKVLLVEARDRIGGRTWTANALGEQFEMGGTWVHWNQPHVYCELQRYGLHRNLKTSAGTFEPVKSLYKSADAEIVEIDGEAANANTEKTATQFFNIDGQSSSTLMPYPHDPLREPAPWKKYDNLSIKQRLDQMTDVPQVEKEMFEALTNSIGSAPGSETAFTEILRWYALGGHTMAGMFELAGVYKIGKGGMTSLARAILTEYLGDFLTNTVIREVKQDATGVTLITNAGKIRAKAVISTIPLNCLADIAFDPPVSPLRQEAIKLGQINRGAKIHFKISQIEPGWFASCQSPRNSKFVFAFSDHNGTKPSGPDGTYCIGFGYNEQLTDKKDSKDIIEAFKSSASPAGEVEAYLTHDWMNDPYAKGVWCCWGPGVMGRYLAELQKPHGKVVFASADWADGWRGFVDEAIERGKKAAWDAQRMLSGGHSKGV